MNKLVATAAAGAFALVASLSATAPSQAFFPGFAVLAGAAVATGAVVATSAAIAGDRWYHDGYFGGPGWDDHVAACAGSYRSYDVRSDTYVRRVHGKLVRVYCEL